MKYNYSKNMWHEIGKYCINAKGEISIHIPTNYKTKEERIIKGEFIVLQVKKIEFKKNMK